MRFDVEKHWFLQRLDQLGKSQDEIAKVIGVSQPAVSQWMNRGTLPKAIIGDPKKGMLLAEALEMSYGELLRRAGWELETETISDLSPTLQQIVRELHNDSEEQLQFFWRFAQLLHDEMFSKDGNTLLQLKLVNERLRQNIDGSNNQGSNS